MKVGVNTIESYENFLGISETVWNETIKNYTNISNNSLSKYLQWYPLQSLDVSDDYFEKVIKKGNFVFDEDIMKISDNYLQKSDGSFRQAQLLSPTLYLVLEAICKEIYNSINDKIYSQHALYAGNLENNDVSYKKQYNLFFKEVNKLSSIYSHYIKVDIKDYFRYIDIDLMFNIIEKNTSNIHSFHIYLYKLLFSFCGKGRFPIVENSTGLSYLATIVYLNEVDEKINEYFHNTLGLFSFRIIRYVDDLYIFFDEADIEQSLGDFFISFINFYQTELRKVNLAVNTDKTHIKHCSEISDDIKNSFYGDEIYNEDIDIHEVDINHYVTFLDNLTRTSFSIDNYKRAVDESFSFEDIQLSKNEVYNRILYKFSDKFVNNHEIITKLDLIINEPIITYDVRKIVTAILNTRDGQLIRKLLNNLFSKSEWNDAENYIAITYLLNRSFRHEDLIEKLYQNLKEKSNNLSQYIENYCLNKSNLSSSELNNSLIDRINKINITPTTSQLYLLYFVELKKENLLLAHSYFKSFFDRVTAEIRFDYKIESKDLNRPNYKGNYTKKELKEVYEEINNSGSIIQKAHQIRNANPVNHASSGLIKGPYDKEEISSSIEGLQLLIIELIDSLELSIGDS